MIDEIGYLIQIVDETEEYQYPISQNYLIGNSAECNLKIVDEDILDFHCRIKSVNDEVRVYSLNLRNPVYLNDEPVSEEGKPLKDNDEIRINNDHQYKWKTITDRRIFSRSLPLQNESLLEVNTRYSDSVLTSWKNVDNFSDQHNLANEISSGNLLSHQKDELLPVKEIPTSSKTDSHEESDNPVSCKINLSSVESENEFESTNEISLKSETSKDPIISFSESNTFVTDSKLDTSKIIHENENHKTELECSTKNIPEDVFEDLILLHSTNQKPFHSTPKATSTKKNRTNDHPSSSLPVNMNFENSVENDFPLLKTCGDIREENEELNETSVCNVFGHEGIKKVISSSKKNVTAPVKRASESFNEGRRNTRGRTSLLRKTFEENSCDNEAKSLTTPEKLKETDNVFQTSFPIDSETENMTENAEYKSSNQSLKTEFTSVSDENDTCEGSFIDKYKICNVVKNVSVSKPAMVAKCARNLSYISPPENNRSQEFMDSMVTTPQKNSPSIRESITDNYNVSATSFLSNTKDSSFDETANTSFSSARKRRSTGFIPFVGTPSNEYRVTRKMSTPFSKSILSRTSIDFECNTGPLKDGKRSSERRSTPFKVPSGKSSIRDSVSYQPTIQESVSFEDLEASNHEHDSINDSKFRFITMRRRPRYGESTFDVKEKILEESELKSDCSELNDDSSFEEENTETSNANLSVLSEEQNEQTRNAEFGTTKTMKNVSDLPKSILSPLPKPLAWKEKSAKKVTFVLPNSTKCTMIKEDSTLSVDESFAMISTKKTEVNSEQSFISDSITFDEELHTSDRQDTDPSDDSLSGIDDFSATNSIVEKIEASSSDVSGIKCLTKIQSNLNDLSGVEQIQSPESSPTKCTAEVMDNNDNETCKEKNPAKDCSEHSSIKFTDMESSLAFVELSNQSNFDENKSNDTRNEIESLEESAQVALNENVNNGNSTNITCSPRLHLSGVKSLFDTPEKLRISMIDQRVRSALNFEVKSKDAAKAGSITEIKSASACKSFEAIKTTAVVKSSRKCKSLNFVEKSYSKLETASEERIQSEFSNTFAEVCDDNVDAQNVVNEELISPKQPVETNLMTEKSEMDYVIPEIVVIEATMVDENANNEDIEIANADSEEVIDNSKLESPSNVSQNHGNKELEKKLNTNLDENHSSEDSTTCNDKSPIISQIRQSVESKIQSDLNTSSSDSDIQLKDDKLCTTIDRLENEQEKMNESNSSNNASAIDTSQNITLPECENKKDKENESPSSVTVLISDRDNSRLSDISSTDYLGRTDSLNTSINESYCNNSRLSDSSVKNISDCDFSKSNFNENGNSDSQLPDVCEEDVIRGEFSRINTVENNFDYSPSVEETSSIDLLENEINKKSEIVESSSTGIETQDNMGDDMRKCENVQEIHNAILMNSSQSTSSSQDMGIRIDASSNLINDLHKELESTPHLMNPSSGEATPVEVIKLVTFPESSNTSGIECVSQVEPEIVIKPDLQLPMKVNDSISTPIKTALRASSTPQSAVRRCRKSLRIHRCNQKDTVDEHCASLHECSIVLDKSQTEAIDDTAKAPRELYNLVVNELKDKLNSAEGKVNPVQESSTIIPNFADINSSVSSSESAQPINSVSPVVQINLSKDETNNYLHPESDSELILNPSQVPITEENNMRLENSTISVTSDNEANLEQTTALSTDMVPNKRKSLRSRKEQSITTVENDSKPRVATRRIQRARTTLWYEKHFHCYLCLNSSIFSKCVRKSRTKQLEQKLIETHDDKENVCSLLKVIEKPKIPESVREQITTTMPIVTEKKTRNPRRLKNVENIAEEAENQHEENISKRSCSIVLPILDPEIMKSPVKVDESGNISTIENTQVATKKKRVTKAVKQSEQKQTPVASRTRQRGTKTVTFNLVQRKSVEETLQPSEKVTQSKVTSKRTLRNQTSASKTETTIKTRKLKIIGNESEGIESGKEFEIHLEPLNIVKLNEPIMKKTRARRATIISKVSEETNEKKIKTQKATKRASENVEDDLPELSKKRRVKTKVTSEISATENAKSENYGENTRELPKRTRAQAKTIVQVEAVSRVNNQGRSTRAVRNQPLENCAGDSCANTKKRVRDTGESSAKIETEKLNKKTRTLKTSEVQVLDELIKPTTAKKPVKKMNLFEKDSTDHNSCKESVASSSKTNPLPRMTRSRKTEIVKSEERGQENTATKTTRVASKSNVGATVSKVDPPISKQVKKIVKKSSVPEKVITKRSVVTRSRKLSITKGKISSTLKTSGRGSLVVRKSLIKPSPAKKTLEDNLITSKLRSTRRRAK